MAQKTSNIGLEKAYIAKAAIDANLLVKADSDDQNVVVATANALVIGVTMEDQDVAGKGVAVVGELGIAEVFASEAVSFGDELVAAANGFVQKASSLTPPVSANVCGIAEADGDAGDLIPMRLARYAKYIAS